MANYYTPPAEDQKMPSDELMARIIRNSIIHAKRVSAREHIKADRAERVNQFLTTLRREMSFHLSNNTNHRVISAALLEKELWYEPGVLNSINPARSSGSWLVRDVIVKWVDLARKNYETDTAAVIITADLEELDRIVGGCLAYCETARRINDESEVVSSKLCELFS